MAPVAEAVRDGAIATGNYPSALKLLESQYAMGGPHASEPRMWSRGLVLVYAHTLMLSGQRQRGRDLLDALMVQVDSESVGRTKDWFSRERATAFAMLGEDERAIEELNNSVETGKLYRWWYLAELDPVFKHLRNHPRFRALAARAQEHRKHQRTLVEDMRRNGEVPDRSG